MGKALSDELSCPCVRSCFNPLYSERPKLCGVLADLSAIGLSRKPVWGTNANNAEPVQQGQ